MRLKAFCSGMVLFVALTGVVAAQPASQWLQRLQEAQDTQGYQGSFVYERKGAFSTHQVWRHVSAEKAIVERFLQLSGPAHEVMRVDGRVTCLSGTMTDIVSSMELWPVQAFTLKALEERYEVRQLGQSRVAGRDTIVLLFAPRDQHRYPVELHIDEATAIPLKTLLLNEQGELLERFQFVQFQPVNDNNLQIVEGTQVIASADCHAVSAVAMKPDAELDMDWTVSWVPPGFSLTNSHYRPSEDSKSNVLTQVYSDGLAHFSVFFEPVDHLTAEGGRRLLGPTSVVSRRVIVDQQPVMVTVVGEIPLGTAERIAVSMQTGQEPSDD